MPRGWSRIGVSWQGAGRIYTGLNSFADGFNNDFRATQPAATLLNLGTPTTCTAGAMLTGSVAFSKTRLRLGLFGYAQVFGRYSCNSASINSE